MDSTVIALILLVAMLALSFLGVHMAWAMGICGLIGLLIIDGPRMVSMQFGEAPYSIVGSYDLATIPMFVLMGIFVAESGLGRDAFDAARLWLGRLPGGLAVATTAANAVFGAASGSTSAAAALFSKLAYPEMIRHGYAKTLASGSICAAGTLAAMIPPSIALVVYGIVGEQSIGRLLIAGIMPGLLQTFVFIVLIVIWVKIKPNDAPRVKMESDTVSLWKRLLSTFKILPIVVIFFFSVAGVFFGIFTPTEGGSVGATAALVVVLAMRRLSKAGFITSMKETAITTGMIMLIIFGGYMFSRMLITSGLIKEVTEWMITLNVSKHLLFFMVVVLLTVAGMLLVPIVMLVIFVPILLPPLKALGYDPIWFGIMFTALIELACITPPVALNIFVVKAVVGKDITTTDIVRGVLPFIGACYLVMIILYIFPQIATWLPSLMYS